MLMVIFGAGASYDSISSHVPIDGDGLLSIRPPLVKDLFANIAEFRKFVDLYPQCRPIVPYLEPHGGEKLMEKVLGELDSETQSDPERKKQLLALRFYIKAVINSCEKGWCTLAGGVSNYSTLLDDIRLSGPALLVTFNYDTLIERALRRDFQRRTDYVDPSGFSVLKLHGSTNWVQIVGGVYSPSSPADSKHIIEAASSLTFQTIIPESEVPILQANPWLHLNPNPDSIPALAIPIADKRDFACPPEHLDYLKQRLPDVTKIAIIGWRGSEAHFTDLLREKLRPDVRGIVVCGPSGESKKTVERLDAAGVPGAFDPLEGGFTEFVRNRGIKKFLAS